MILPCPFSFLCSLPFCGPQECGEQKKKEELLALVCSAAKSGKVWQPLKDCKRMMVSLMSKAPPAQGTRKTEESKMACMCSSHVAAANPLVHRKKCSNRNRLLTSVLRPVAGSGLMAYNGSHFESTCSVEALCQERCLERLQ